MSSRLRILSLLSTSVVLCATVCGSLASFSAPLYALSDDELGHLSQNCATIKQSLSQLQRADSRTRVVLGAAYENIANNFIKPLNLRLVSLDRPEPSLSSIQADFTLEQANFRASYTEYMRAMETLLAIDCRTEPESFYEQLVAARASRSQLQKTVTQLNSYVSSEIAEVKKLQEGLK